MVGVVSASALGSKTCMGEVLQGSGTPVVRSSEASASRRFLISSTVVSIRSLVLVRFLEVVRFSEGPL